MSPTTFVLLFTAIGLEVTGTSFLQRSEQFTRLWPSLITLGCYALSFYFLALVLRFMPLGIAYAIWGGLGMVLVAVIGYVVFHQKLDAAAIIGLGFIVTGVLIVNLFSSSATH